MIEDELHLVGADRRELEAAVAAHPFPCLTRGTSGIAADRERSSSSRSVISKERRAVFV
jgi:hypothetical protein